MGYVGVRVGPLIRVSSSHADRRFYKPRWAVTFFGGIYRYNRLGEKAAMRQTAIDAERYLAERAAS